MRTIPYLTIPYNIIPGHTTPHHTIVFYHCVTCLDWKATAWRIGDDQTSDERPEDLHLLSTSLRIYGDTGRGTGRGRGEITAHYTWPQSLR